MNSNRPPGPICSRMYSAGHLLVLLGVWLVLCSAPAAAQTPNPLLDDRVHDLAKQMNCPTCAGRNLADCPTDTCKQWKDEIRAQLEAGKSDQEVLAYFQARFGPTVMQEPPKEGALLVVWAVPIAATAFLIGVGVWAVQRASARKPAGASSASSPDPSGDPYLAALEEQVRQ
ncbi:MAG: cytochrome c-type biogenesis protein CcmH [Anaerolineae bacterium]|nr:cytochrome c-type biogenesis protein CcmH [Thermoflexales bacterium]MDW8406773.1 cytochrome c-type biogenesis protein CcmH [Anaerolineae bacterium]